MCPKEFSLSGRRFVIQRHQARSLHYDLRLEHDGVFKSWALPKGVPIEVGVRHLAIQTEDHDLTFGNFQGEIPADQYGAGQIEIWGGGEEDEEEWSPHAITVSLHGTFVMGQYRLVRFPRRGDRAWLIWKVVSLSSTPRQMHG